MKNSRVYTRLNHLNVFLSYNQVLSIIKTIISQRNTLPLQRWIADEAMFKFVGENVDKTKRVRDIRSDHRAEWKHMYSLLAVKYRVIAPSTCGKFVCLESIPIANFLPTKADAVVLKSNLVVLVSRILVKYVKPLSKLSRVVSHHILHTHSAEMKLKSETAILDVMHTHSAEVKLKSETAILDVMHKNEAKK